MRSHVLLLLCASSSLLVWQGAVRAEPPAEVTPSPSSEPLPTPEAPAEVSAPALSVEPAVEGPPLAQPPVTAPVAPSGPPELAELTSRIQALERIDPLDDSVRRPVDFAKAALERSRASRALGDAAAEARTRQLSRAAVELAEARLHLQRERALFTTVQARRMASLAEQNIAKQALERERARALELARESGTP